MRTTLGRNGTGYTTGTFKTYDVWGSVRSSDTTSPNPTQRYCASLGHVSDDDSGLIYMRARYHEPSTGRFISEDPARDGWNWFVYCGNDPLNRVDANGQLDIPVLTQLLKVARNFLKVSIPDWMWRYASTFDHIAGTIGGSALFFAAAITIAALPVTGIVAGLFVAFAAVTLVTVALLIAIDGFMDIMEEAGGPYWDGQGDVFEGEQP